MSQKPAWKLKILPPAKKKLCFTVDKAECLWIGLGFGFRFIISPHGAPAFGTSIVDYQGSLQRYARTTQDNLGTPTM